MPDDESRIARLEAAVSKNTAAINSITARLAELHEANGNAMRTARESVHELESISQGLMRHMANSDKLRAEENARMEKVRSEAAAKHAARFDDVHAALHKQSLDIANLAKSTEDAVSKAMKGRNNGSALLVALATLVIPALTVSGMTLIDEWKKPVPVYVTPSLPPPERH